MNGRNGSVEMGDLKLGCFIDRGMGFHPKGNKKNPSLLWGYCMPHLPSMDPRFSWLVSEMY